MMQAIDFPQVQADFRAAGPVSLAAPPTLLGNDADYIEIFKSRRMGDYYGHPGIIEAAWNRRVDGAELHALGGRFLNLDLYGQQLEASAKKIAALRDVQNVSFALVHARVDLNKSRHDTNPWPHSVALKIDFKSGHMYYQDSLGKDKFRMQDNVRTALESRLGCEVTNLYVIQQEGQGNAACSVYTLDNLVRMMRGEKIGLLSDSYIIGERRADATLVLQQMEKYFIAQSKIHRCTTMRLAAEAIDKRDPHIDLGENYAFISCLIQLEAGKPLDKIVQYNALYSGKVVKPPFSPRTNALIS